MLQGAELSLSNDLSGALESLRHGVIVERLAACSAGVARIEGEVAKGQRDEIAQLAVLVRC